MNDDHIGCIRIDRDGFDGFEYEVFEAATDMGATWPAGRVEAVAAAKEKYDRTVLAVMRLKRAVAAPRTDYRAESQQVLTDALNIAYQGQADAGKYLTDAVEGKHDGQFRTVAA